MAQNDKNNSVQKPAIYLGLGGTGNLAISYAKKLYEEEYGKGNIPSSIAFVGVDFQTDMDKNALLATDISDDFIRIQTATNPKDYYKIRHNDHDEYQWMFKCNEGNIDNNISRGARAVRTTGRLYTEMVLDNVMSKLRSTISRVKSFDNNAIASDEIMIYMVMSLAGGTGAGSFITLANQIKIEYGNAVTLYGYGITHSVFRTMDPIGNRMPNVELNAVSSILDLDYIFTKNSKLETLKLEVGPKTTELKDYLFDGFFVIDNDTERGNVIREVKELCEVIGTCLYAYGGEAGSTIEATINNVGPKSGNYNVDNKLGWVQSIGACQVVYKGELMAQTYGLKAAKELIRKLRKEGPDMQSKAQDWTEQVLIREDGDQYNMLTDRIYSPSDIQNIPMPLLDAQQSDDFNEDYLKQYLGTLVKYPSQQDIDNIATDLEKKLCDKIEEFLKYENAIGNSLEFLRSLKAFCEKYRKEMNEEAKDFANERTKKLKDFLQKSFDDYNKDKHKFFNRDKNQDILDEAVGIPAKEILKLSHEEARRKDAANIYVSLLAKINSFINILNTIDKQLDNLSGVYRKDVTKIQSVTADALKFEYDLSYNERINMTVNSSDVVVADFINTLGGSLLNINVANLSAEILKYTSNLPRANEYKNKILTQVIDGLPQDEYETLKREIIAKSSRWLTIDDRGQCVNGSGKTVSNAIVKNMVVSVYEPSEGYKSRLDKDVNFLNDDKQFLYIDKDIAKQRMIFCRIDGSIIPYCINVFGGNVMDRYYDHIERIESGTMLFNPHFDKQIFEKMREEDFKLKPERK